MFRKLKSVVVFLKKKNKNKKQKQKQKQRNKDAFPSYITLKYVQVLNMSGKALI